MTSAGLSIESRQSAVVPKMRSSTLLGIFIVYYFVALTRGGLPDSGRTCENQHSITTGQDSQDDFCWLQAGTRTWPKQNCLRAAVVEYNRLDNTDCRIMSNGNLDAYEEIARVARENGAKMVVFPEDGILANTAKSMFPCLEEIPDPDTLAGDSNPCLESLGDTFPILTRLSCLALKNKIYLIANYGTKERRNSSDIIDRQAKKNSDYMMLNTDVVFEPTGKFIKRYRKWNPFTETEIFEKAPKLEHVYFDTDFGRFGVFTCFDMMFRKPAIELVEQYHIDTAIFPTWWFDELPLLSAVQFQDGWSATNQVNLLASNILKPFRGSLGSSIFSGNNSVYVAPEDYNSQEQGRRTKILLGTIQTSRIGGVCTEDFSPKIIEFGTEIQQEKYRHKNYKLNINDSIRMLEDSLEGSQSVCSGEICCKIDYKLSNQSRSDIISGRIDRGKVVVIARDGRRPGFYQWYEQVCALATLKKPCGLCDSETLLKSLEFGEDGLVGFERLSIEARFQSKYVYPTCGHNLSKLVDRNRRLFNCSKMETSSSGSSDVDDVFHCRLDLVVDENPTSTEANSLYSFGLYGRVYERDLKQ